MSGCITYLSLNGDWYKDYFKYKLYSNSKFNGLI